MIIRFKLFGVRVTIAAARMIHVAGVNSTLADGKHILMWDFDEVDYNTVEKELKDAQKRYNLSNIYIFQTSASHYCAYCFKRCTLLQAINIISSCPSVDVTFVKYGLYREKFTLRIGEKGKKPRPRLFNMLHSEVKEDVTIDELDSYIIYETLSKC